MKLIALLLALAIGACGVADAIAELAAPAASFTADDRGDGDRATSGTEVGRRCVGDASARLRGRRNLSLDAVGVGVFAAMRPGGGDAGRRLKALELS